MNFKKCKTSTLGTHACTNPLIFHHVHVLIIDFNYIYIYISRRFKGPNIGLMNMIFSHVLKMKYDKRKERNQIKCKKVMIILSTYSLNLICAKCCKCCNYTIVQIKHKRIVNIRTYIQNKTSSIYEFNGHFWFSWPFSLGPKLEERHLKQKHNMDHLLFQINCYNITKMIKNDPLLLWCHTWWKTFPFW